MDTVHAVAMAVTSLQVLLAAVHSERGLGEAILSGVEERRLADAAAAHKLHLAADELPQVGWWGAVRPTHMPYTGAAL